MSLKLNSSSGGSVTLQEPTTASNLTFTLPSADGTNGQFMQTNGSGVLSFATATSYIGPSSQLFTSSGTFTVPSGITAVKITVSGGGGGGAGIFSVDEFRAGYNGGYGGTAIAFVTGLTPGGTISITVGAAGTAGAAGNNAGGTGGTSSAGAYASASGGVGGGNNSGTWGAGGAGTTGTFIGKGAGGATVINGSLFGIGGASRTSDGTGNAGTGRGAPGSGGASSSAATFAGGAGSAGMVLVEW